jgi:hypothetical protein
MSVDIDIKPLPLCDRCWDACWFHGLAFPDEDPTEIWAREREWWAKTRAYNADSTNALDKDEG